jgi:hypothetical protein
VPLVYSVEHFPYTARRRWHIDVAQFNTTVESVDDSVDDRRRRAYGAGLARALDAQWIGRRRHVMGSECEERNIVGAGHGVVRERA